MKPATDLDVPTFIRNGLKPKRRERDYRRRNSYDFGGLVQRSRFQALFIDFCRRAASGELIWR